MYRDVLQESYGRNDVSNVDWLDQRRRIGADDTRLDIDARRDEVLLVQFQVAVRANSDCEGIQHKHQCYSADAIK